MMTMTNTGNLTVYSPSAEAQTLLLGAAFGLLIFVGFTGNILVCVAIYTNRTLRKKENLYFVSLAGADLLLTVLVMPFAAVNDLMDSWPFGAYCKYWMCIDILCCTASILHLAAISFDRYFHINDPMRYEERMTKRKIVAAIFAVWSVSAVVAFTPLAFDTYFHKALTVQNRTYLRGHVGAAEDKFGSETHLVYQCKFNLDPLYALLSSLTSFYIPCVVMIAAYGKLYRHARGHSLAIRKQQEEVRVPLLLRNKCEKTSDVNCNRQSTGNDATTKTEKIKKRMQKWTKIEGDQKARVTLGVITGVFVATWLPFFIANIAQSWCRQQAENRTVCELGNDCAIVSAAGGNGPCVPDWLFILLTWMGYANSAQNPIIYTIFNRDFRRAFRKILLCGRARRHATTSPVIIADSPQNASAARLCKRPLSKHISTFSYNDNGERRSSRRETTATNGSAVF